MENKDVAIKAWEVYQGLAKGMGENCWKVRSIFVSLTTAVIAFGYTSDSPVLYLLSAFIAPVFFLTEAGYRRLQEQCFTKCKEIETTINDFIAGEQHPRFPDHGIGTGFDTPSFGSLLDLLHVKRFLFWMPYLVFMILPIMLFFFGLTKSN